MAKDLTRAVFQFKTIGNLAKAAFTGGMPPPADEGDKSSIIPPARVPKTKPTKGNTSLASARFAALIRHPPNQPIPCLSSTAAKAENNPIKQASTNA